MSSLFRSLPILLLLAAAIAGPLAAPNASAQGNAVLFVAVAAGTGTDRIQTSADGFTWELRTNPDANAPWLGVAYGNSTWVAVGSASTGTSNVITSLDGVSWTLRSSGVGNTWQALAFDDVNDAFVATANTGTGNRAMFSIDNGTSWSAATTPEDNDWVSVACGGGSCVSVASAGTNRVMTSDDGGATWTGRVVTANPWREVTYLESAGLFVAVANSGTNRIMTSDDGGATWTDRAAAAANSWIAIGSSTSRAVALAFDGSDRVMVSDDGVAWAASAGPSMGTPENIAHGGGTFVAVSSGDVWSSPEGTIWTERTAAAASVWRAVASSGEAAVSVPDDESTLVSVFVTSVGQVLGLSPVAATGVTGAIVFGAILYGVRGNVVAVATVAIVAVSALHLAGLVPLWVAIVVALLGLSFVAKRLG